MKSALLGRILRRLAVFERLLPTRISLPIRVRLQSVLGVIESEYSLLPLFCRPDKKSIDIGANAGVYTYAMSKYSSEVYAFEPIKILADRLESVGINNVQVQNIALSDRSGIENIHVPLIAGQSIFTRASLHGIDGKYIDQSVEVVTLDSRDLKNVGFIKIDVEGHEYSVLKGAIETIELSVPRILIEIEERRLGNVGIETVFDWFRARGYMGWFYLDGIRKSIDEFDVETHQTHGAEFFKDGGYINNFVFIHKTDSLVLPNRLV